MIKPYIGLLSIRHGLGPLYTFTNRVCACVCVKMLTSEVCGIDFAESADIDSPVG